jgi:hypothetical protein
VFGDDVDGPVPPGEAQQPVDVLVREPLLRGLAGLPPTVVYGATSETTTALAAMIAPSPMVTPGMTTASRPIHTSFPMTVLPRLWILGRNSAVFSSQVPPKMKNGKAVEPIIGWFAEDKRNLASTAMAQNLPIISFSGPAV